MDAKTRQGATRASIELGPTSEEGSIPATPTYSADDYNADNSKTVAPVERKSGLMLWAVGLAALIGGVVLYKSRKKSKKHR